MDKFILTFIIFSHIFILSKLIFFPYPELFIYPYLTNQGLKPYMQILDQHFPGLMFLPINLDNLGMVNQDIARFWLFIIVATTQVLLFVISKDILGGKKALIVNFLYLLWQPFFEGWVLWIDNFLPLFLLPAFYFTHKKKFLLSGIFLGLGIVMKQTIIPLTGLIFLYLLWRREFNSLWRYSLGVLIPIFLMITFIFKEGYLSHFWYWTVVFNLTIFAKYGTQIPTNWAFLSRVLFSYGVSLTALFLNQNTSQLAAGMNGSQKNLPEGILRSLLRSSSFSKERDLKIILGLFLIGSSVGAFDRANFIHFQPSLPFVVIATALGFYSLAKNRFGFILFGIYLSITILWQITFYKGHISDHVFFFDESTFAISDKIRQYTNPGDKIFVFGAVPHLYQMSQTLPAGDLFVFQFPWFLRVAEDRLLEGIKKDRVEIVVSDRTVEIDGIPITEFESKIDKYLMENYQEIDGVGSVRILKRK